MNNPKSSGLLEALKIIGWPDIPKAIDANYNATWLKAIVRVKRSNGEENYCLAANDGQGKVKVIRDLAPTGIIVAIVSIHPYEEASAKNIIPKFRNDDQIRKYFRKTDFAAAEIESLLTTEGKTDEQIKANRTRLNSLIEQVAIEQAKKMSEINAESKRIIANADPKLIEKNVKAKKYGRATTPRKTKRSKSEN